jgi:hypothetical protein
MRSAIEMRKDIYIHPMNGDGSRMRISNNNHDESYTNNLKIASFDLTANIAF